MLTNLRNALMAGKRLPFDAEVEYLESTGTQYIDTGISGAEHNLIITAGVRINTYSAYAGAFGNYASETANSFRLILAGLNNGQAYANCGYVTSSSHIITNFSLGNWHTVILNGAEDRCFCDGVKFTKGNRYIQGTANANTIRIFTSGGAAAGTWSKQVSAFKIELNGVLVRDFIPVRKGTVGSLYDRVSGKLFGNAGTGDFVLGQDVVPVEYIESHGTEYIDTGVTSGPSNLEFTIDCTITNTIGTSEPYWTGSGVYSVGGLHYVLEQRGIRTGGGTVTNSIPYTSGERVQIRTYYDEQNRRNVQIGDRYYYGSAYSAPTANLFLLRMLNLANQRGLFFGATVSQSGALVRKFLPVRVGTEGATMDVLTRRIYRNAGTGAFTYGNDLKYPIPAE